MKKKRRHPFRRFLIFLVLLAAGYLLWKELSVDQIPHQEKDHIAEPLTPLPREGFQQATDSKMIPPAQDQTKPKHQSQQLESQLLFNQDMTGSKPSKIENPSIIDVLNAPLKVVGAWKTEDGWVTHGDILVEEKNLDKSVGDEKRRIANLPQVNYWPYRRVPYEISANLNKKIIDEAIFEIISRTSIEFVERQDEPDYLYFRPSSGDQCMSYLGKIGGKQDVLIHASCQKGQVLHEILHALGFVHEQSREDRDRFIQIFWDNIEDAYKPQFQKLNAAISQPVDLPFDFSSIMLYPSEAFSANGEATMLTIDGETFSANRSGLSDSDVERIELLYSQD